MALVKFYAGTLAAYQGLAKKDANALYFITDATPPVLYKGDALYTKNWVVVSTLPEENQIQGVLYLNSQDGAFYSWNGTSWDSVTKAFETTVTEDSDKLITSGAVYSAIQSAVEGLTGGSVLVKNVTASDTAGKVKVETGSGTTEFAIKGVIINPEYEPTERKITLHYADGTSDVVINLGKDLVVQSGEYVEEEKKIKLTLTSGDTIEIPVAELIDVYTGDTSDTVTVTVNGTNEIKADVKLAVAGEGETNNLVARTDGLFVDVATPVATALAQAKAYTDTAKQELTQTITGIDGRVTANTNAITTLNGNSETPGSVDFKVAAGVTQAKAYTDAALTWGTIGG